MDGWLVWNGPTSFVLLWTDVAQRRVQAAAIVEAFDVLKQGCSGGIVVGEGGSVDEFVLEGREEALHDGIDAPMFRQGCFRQLAPSQGSSFAG